MPKLPAAALLCLALAACSAQDAPRPATLVAATPAQADLGTLRVHYNALPTLALSDGVARRYGIARDAETALVVIALRRVQDGEELPASGQVSAVAADLSGRRQPIAMREAVTDAYTDYVGTVRISEHDQLNLQVDVRSADGAGTVRFARTF
ncbi:DUF4426 domain-containing protein [Xanthomonas translucens]|uniref:DUF4426 domain-containing protein n=1 Tax=Xanthomonas campestris pv. translucens TaxID=343 RepID=UPI00071E9AFE|nr:DUF4426 domain-containing protein [Xanthomonas translucens]KTF40718.1 hypothetical protein OZ12_05420 [Xanthomonas translucens pv. translucens]KWV11754.1 hypothetical protein ATB54_17155 [Xanthomonas translucens]MCS3358604.1 DUF4426 domain-containing protein [Xanthomonas translucens pv. translucens]MCS3372773.1 DUF4426 domain-containing protein [Xanthomonas translucens pv. translucens]MCT8273075.1 DUF4426 domain-containing protein [Xanthomonas translucens pv. translucens]